MDSAAYRLYLVTGRELLPPGITYLESLEATLKEGYVRIVQLRYVASLTKGETPGRRRTRALGP